MKWLRYVLGGTLILICVVLGVNFGRAHSDPVIVDYGLFSTHLPLAETLAIFFASGLVLGASIMLVVGWWNTRRKLAAQRRELADEKSRLPPQQSKEPPPQLEG